MPRANFIRTFILKLAIMIFQLILIVFAILGYAYHKLSKNRDYWSDRGVTNTGFKFFWGDDGSLLGEESFHQMFLRLYKSYPGNN